MLLAIFGVPTATASLGAQIVQSVVRSAAGPTDIQTCRSLDELRSAWGSRTGQNILYYNESPSGEILRFFKKVKTPLLLFADDPIEVGVSLIAERSLELLQAIRVSSLCTVSLNELLRGSDVLRISTSRHSSVTLGELIRSIAAFYRFPPQDLLVEAVVSDVSFSLGLEKPVSPSTPWCELASSVSPSVQAAMSAAEFDFLESTLSYYRDPATSRLKWACKLFMTAANSVLGSSPIDLTGPSRLFIHGPYMGLPCGRWVARFEFEACRNTFGFNILVHVIADEYLKTGRLAVPHDGRFLTEITFTANDPSVPLQIQFLLERGAIGGEFRLLSMEILRDEAS